MSILIKNALLDNKKKDIYIEGSRVSEIGSNISAEAEYRIDGSGMAAIPGLINGHAHAAMSLLRGYADDMALDEWLRNRIWPLEAKLTEKDVYWGSRLSCLEMIKTGTTCFNDMYWHFHGTARAALDSGLRAVISSVFLDTFDEKKAKEQIRESISLLKESKGYGSRITFAMGPHAIYTVSANSLQWIKEFADKNRLLIHLHLSETEKEVEDCMKMHKKRPVEYLDDLGFLGKNLVAGHAVWLNQKETLLLKKNNVKLVHNPSSNMKLCTGRVFPYSGLKKAGLTIGLGTDSSASNNSLDMFEEMKTAALLQKFSTDNPVIMPAKEALSMATLGSAMALGIDAGEIAENKLADILLIDLKNIQMLPRHNLISNLVYSANGSCVDTTICDGKLLMQGRKVDDEEKVIEGFMEHAEKLTG